MQVIQRTAFIESVLQATLSPGMSASLDWSRGVRPGALTN
jgi:conjugative transfer pilus assembly protein TraH